jgi:DNA repair protein RecO (recombination protein O)
LPETTVTAIVLRRTDAGENDRRLVLFTRERGKIDAIAKGARKGGSRLAGVSEPLMVATFHLASGRVRSFVTQAQPISSLPALRKDFVRLVCGLAMVELVATHMPYEAEHPEVFDALSVALSVLGGDGDPAVPLVWFAARLLSGEGLMPDWRMCAVTRREIMTATRWYSHAAGGVIIEGEAERFVDSRRASAEALTGIERIAELAKPPERLKRSVECSAVLFRYWQGVLDSPLPAWERAVQALSGDGE